MVHSAAVQDRDGARLLFRRIRVEVRLPRVKMKTVFADGGYGGWPLAWWVDSETGWTLSVVKRVGSHSFSVLPKRWIVEWTFGCFMFWRVLNRHYECRSDTVENVVYIVMIRDMLRRLTRKGKSEKTA